MLEFEQFFYALDSEKFCRPTQNISNPRVPESTALQNYRTSLYEGADSGDIRGRLFHLSQIERLLCH